MLRDRKHIACFTAAAFLTCGFLQAQETTKAEKDVRQSDSATKSESGKKKKKNGKDTGARAKEFLRLERDANEKPLALQTGVTRYVKGRGKDKVSVDLVSAVHVGDRSYYDELNKLFTEYDVVLYELVAPKGVRPVMGEQRGGNPVSFLQNSMTSMLNLESQTALVNYKKKNFVHADMTPTEISAKMAERGDTGLSVALDVMADMVRQMNKQQQTGLLSAQGGEMDILSLLMDDNSDKKLKLMMAEQFIAQGSLDQGLGKKLNQMLVLDRNGAAMKVLEKELAKGHKKIALFYGAAHMNDFEKRLIEEQGMRFKRNKWLTAWDLTKESKATRKPESDPLKMLFKLLDDASK